MLEIEPFRLIFSRKPLCFWTSCQRNTLTDLLTHGLGNLRNYRVTKLPISLRISLTTIGLLVVREAHESGAFPRSQSAWDFAVGCSIKISDPSL